MSDRLPVLVYRSLAAVGATLAVGGSLWAIGAGHTGFYREQGGDFVTVYAAFLAVMVWMVIPRQPANALVKVTAVSGFLFGLFTVAIPITTSMVNPELLLAESTTPMDLPTAAAWAAAYLAIGWMPPMFTLLTFGLVLFPDGRLPSPRWRIMAAFTVAVIVAGTLGTMWDYRPGATTRYEAGLGDDPTAAVVVTAAMMAVVLSLVALVRRFRASRGEARQQFKWVVWGASLLISGLTAAFFLDQTSYQPVSNALLYLGGAALLVSYGIAVGKYRLYDVDVVISRTVVYGALAAFITGVYIAVVLSVGSLLGAEGESNPLLAIGATALVAFAFEPLRERLQRLANRLVYGRRSTPYEALSEFSRNLTTTDTALLDRVARSLAGATTAAEAAVWECRDGMLTRVAAWPEGDDVPPPVTTGDVSRLPGVDLAKPVTHDGELLGALTLTAARGQALLSADEQLVDHLASGMGLALRNLRLDEDLRHQVQELDRSRQRIVAVQDETRRRLERDLHDGAQQRLVALKVRLALACKQAEAAAATEVVETLERVTAETDRSINALRDFARGIYPPRLEAEGLGAAVEAQARRFPLPVTVHAAGVGRHPRPVEAAVYFSVLEALQNVVKHAAATSAHVALRQDDGALHFEVTDDGRGFDPAAAHQGSGLANLTDRLDALGGALEIESHPGAGTTVRGTVPIRVAEPVP